MGIRIWINIILGWFKSALAWAKKRFTPLDIRPNAVPDRMYKEAKHLAGSENKVSETEEKMIHHTFKSPNFSNRTHVIDSIILHHTGGTSPGCIIWLCSDESKVSSHYVVTQEGQIYELVEPVNKAWHAGRGAFDLNKDGTISADEKNWNNRSIGIELEAYEPYEYSQFLMESTDWLVKYLMHRYNIKPEAILGHKEIAPERKIDPAKFDMNAYRQKASALFV